MPKCTLFIQNIEKYDFQTSARNITYFHGIFHFILWPIHSTGANEKMKGSFKSKQLNKQNLIPILVSDFKAEFSNSMKCVQNSDRSVEATNKME